MGCRFNTPSRRGMHFTYPLFSGQQKKPLTNGRRLVIARLLDPGRQSRPRLFHGARERLPDRRRFVKKKASRGRPDVRHWLDDDLDTVSTIFRTESTREVASGRSSSLLLASFLRFP